MRFDILARPMNAAVVAAVGLIMVVGCSDEPDPTDASGTGSSIGLSATDSTEAPSGTGNPPATGEGRGSTDVAPTPQDVDSTTPSEASPPTSSAGGSTSSNAPSSAPASTTPATPPVVDWSNVVPAEVVLNIDVLSGRGRTRAWLLRFDDRLTLDVAQGLALEAQAYGISDENGALALFADGSWIGDCDECLDPDAVGGAATLMEVMLIGGFFGDYDPDPRSPNGHELIVRTFSGSLGRESADQRSYLVGSSRLGPMADWEGEIVELLPELSSGEYLAAVAFEHPCGSEPAGACF